MTVTVPQGARQGEVWAPASKSQAHRLLLCAALGRQPVTLRCDGISRDIAATVACLNALGADIREERQGFLTVRPIEETPRGLCRLPCGESGSTLRFLLPVVGALGARAAFEMEGRLPERPLAPLDELLCAHGMTLRREGASLLCEGQLTAGAFSVPGDISSQYISGLLLALPLLEGDSLLTVTGGLESAGYVTMTEEALALSGVSLGREERVYRIRGGQRPALPPELAVEGDYSGAAFFLCMGALSEAGVTVRGLSPTSSQGDRAVLDILRQFGAVVEQQDDAVTVRRGRLRGIVIDAAQVPDLIPVLAVVATAAEGHTRVENAARLRLKESDRLKSTTAMLLAIGADATELAAGLSICKRPLTGGRVDPWGDHRIAMSAAVAAGVCQGPVVVEGAECTDKSYPKFWEVLARMARA